MNYVIKELKERDYQRVSEIYTQGILGGHSTFQSFAPSYEAWNKSHFEFCRLGAFEENDFLIGWAAISPTISRYPYRGVAELSIYIDNDYKRRGIGLALLNELSGKCGKFGIWTLESLIFADNAASANMHEKAGFRLVGKRERIAADMHGIWHDTIIMEKRLDDKDVNFAAFD